VFVWNALSLCKRNVLALEYSTTTHIIHRLLTVSTIILLRGPLGIGKTAASQALAKRLNAAYVSVDNALEKLQLDTSAGVCIPLQNFIEAQKHVLPLIKEALSEGKRVIIDGNFYHKEQLDHFADHFGHDLQIYTLRASVQTCIERDLKRQKPYGEDAARAVHGLVSQFDAGIIIDTEGKLCDEVVNEILLEEQQLQAPSR
jgi:predicted kinase